MITKMWGLDDMENIGVIAFKVLSGNDKIDCEKFPVKCRQKNKPIYGEEMTKHNPSPILH
jgi:hypothetical protein